jgi:O-succinylhomoserine sulfhydrylase
MNPRDLSFETLAVRTGHARTHEGEHSEPIFATSSFVFESAAHAAARFSGDSPGNIYARFSSPTVRVFEERMAALEGGEACVSTATGMAGIFAICASLLESGDHVVASRSVFGSTVVMLEQILARFGIETTFVPLTDESAWQEAIQARTKLLFLETPSNPLTELADIEKTARMAHDHGCLLAVDNTFCTPALQRPLALGADIVVSSATKFLDGQGRCLGGAVVGSQDIVGEKIYGTLRTLGPTLSPFNAWVLLKGLETLPLRMAAHSESGLALARWLEAHPAVSRVYYPGLESHSQHELARRQQTGFGGVVGFDVAGGREAAWAVVDACQWLSITANLGDTKTTITHPATTTHSRLTDEQRAAAGIGQGLLRVAVGLEAVADIQADLSRGLDALAA